MSITREGVKTVFAKLAGHRPQSFFDHVADNVSWTVLGSHALAGHYSSKAAFQEATFARLGELFEGGLKLFTRDVLSDGDQAAAELYIHATSKSGAQFNNESCWV
jgi:uncharacterized protein